MRLVGNPETTNAGCRNAVEAFVHPALEPARLKGPTSRGGLGADLLEGKEKGKDLVLSMYPRSTSL